MVRMQIRGVVMPWFRREDYDRIRKIMEGGDKWLRDYNEWETRAERQAKDAEVQGYVVERVYVDPDDFEAWCAAGDHKADSIGRQRYAVERAAAKFKNQSWSRMMAGAWAVLLSRPARSRPNLSKSDSRSVTIRLNGCVGIALVGRGRRIWPNRPPIAARRSWVWLVFSAMTMIGMGGTLTLIKWPVSALPLFARRERNVLVDYAASARELVIELRKDPRSGRTSSPCSAAHRHKSFRGRICRK
jgi:hypothetical protein